MAARPKKPAALLPGEIFISHSHHDRSFTLKVAEDLRRHGVPAWFSARSILGAQQWLEEIGSALERCDWMIVVLTPQSVASHWVQQEVRFALAERSYRNRVIPLLLRKCEPKKLAWPLANLQFIKARPYEAGLRQLLATWGIGYRSE